MFFVRGKRERVVGREGREVYKGEGDAEEEEISILQVQEFDT